MTREVDPHRDEKISRRTLLRAAALAPAAVALSARAQQTSGEAAAEGRPPNGKVALVTGSSRGIGAAIAKRLALDGYKVTVNCVASKDLAAGVVRDIEVAGGQAIWRQADISDPLAVRRLFERERRGVRRRRRRRRECGDHASRTVREDERRGS